MDANNKIRGSLFLFVFLVWSYLVFSAGFIYQADQFVYHFFSQHQNPVWLHLNSGLTNLGSSWFILLFIFVLSLILFKTSKKKMEFAYFGLSVTALCLNFLIKIIFHRMRPVIYLPDMSLTTFAYPSGHALGAVLLMGYLLFIINRGSRTQGHFLRSSHLPSWSSQMEPPPHRAFGPMNLISVKIMVVFLCTWIAASRIFLGVHWLSDVVGGLLTGFFWLEISGWIKP